jgi:Tfp pilus assembly protein PilF
MKQTMRFLLGSLAFLAWLLNGCGVHSEPVRDVEQADFHYKLANGHFYSQEIHMALRELTRSLELNADHPDANHLMAFILYGRKEVARAERFYRHAVEIRPGFHDARANLGVLLLSQRRWREAIQLLTPLTKATLYGTPWLVHNNLGYAYTQLGQHSKALKHYRLAVFHNPKFCLGYNNLGALYKKLGQQDLAIDYLERATTRCKTYAEPHFHLGEIFQHRGALKQARQAFGLCYKASPESPFGRRCRVRM